MASQSTFSASDQKRVYLWTIPGSLSSAFLRAMNNADGTKGMLEPYCQAYYSGSERVSRRYIREPPIDGSTFADIKALVEGPHPGVKVVFIKDMAYQLVAGPQPLADSVPVGYKHTFLIRNPHKSLPSYYKRCVNKEETGWDHFDPRQAGFKELHDVFNYVTETLEQEAIILDADDLLSHPEDMIRQYCAKTELEFQRVMLHWEEALPEKLDIFKAWPDGWFRTMLANTSFNKDVCKPMEDISNQPQAVQEAILYCLPYYKKLWRLRMLPREDFTSSL